MTEPQLTENRLFFELDAGSTGSWGREGSGGVGGLFEWYEEGDSNVEAVGE